MQASCNLELFSKIDGMSLGEILEVIRKAGFTHLDFSFTFENGRRVAFETDERKFIDAVKKSPLEVDWVHTSFIAARPDTSDADLRHISMCAYKFQMQHIADLNPRAFVVHPFFLEMDQKPSREDALERLVDFFKELIDFGGELGIPVVTENLPEDESTGVVSFLLDEIPALGLCLDAGHAEMTGSWDVWLGKYASRVLCTHFQDNDGTADQHLFPGDGVIDWPDLGKRLRDKNYKGVWGLEIKPIVYPLPAEELAVRAYDAVKMIAGER